MQPVWAQTFAYARYVHIHRALLYVICPTPNPVKQLAAIEGSIRVPQKHREQLDLGGTEIQILPRNFNGATPYIDTNATIFQNWLLLSLYNLNKCGDLLYHLFATHGRDNLCIEIRMCAVMSNQG